MKTSERWAQIEELFHRASECDPKDRAAVLAEACNGDLELQHEVEALLASEKSATRDIDAAMVDGLDAVIFPLVGATVSHYRILGGLGVGGMGLLYRAEDTRLGRKVALKFLLEESARNPAALARFEREARSISALEHPNICPVYEFGEHDGQPFLVMPLLEGQTLREMISARDRDKPLETTKLLDFAIQIANGLETAHRHGIIHRDIKPANLFVTTEGQVKILDFGLAKLRQPEIPEATTLPEATKTQQAPDASVTFTRSGAAMGTAGYMSPEQVRGEDLDARTDVFSFGAVLYEMATGQPAFRGETVATRCQAILNDTPTPARKLNSEVPLRLEAILDKALMKDRAARYQTVSAMRSDLEALKRSLESKGRRVALALAALGMIALVGAVLWFVRHQAFMRALPEITQRQLTTNSVENSVGAAAISPNGKYLAYCDQHGLQLQVIQTGQTRTVAQEEICAGGPLNWNLGWFPDDERLLGSGTVNSLSGTPPGVWSVPVEGGTVHKLRGDAGDASASPNGSLVAFTTNPGDVRWGREIWLMDADGSRARKLYEADEQSGFANIRWSPNGQRLIYVKVRSSSAGALESTLESLDLGGGPPTLVASPAPDDYDWVSERTIMFVQSDPNLNGSNFWELRVDPRTGQPQGKSSQLTNWADFAIDSMSATAGGKQLCFRRSTDEGASYVAQLSKKGTRMTTPKRLTPVEGTAEVYAWTPDNKGVLMYAARNGVRGIYRQSVDKDFAEPIVTGLVVLDNQRQIRLTPDRASLLYWVPEKQAPASTTRLSVLNLMRVPIAGGPSNLVLSTSPGTAWADVRCAKSPANVCVFLEAEGDRTEGTFSAFDPVRGRDRQLFKLSDVALGKNWDRGWDVSPDGRSIAFIRKDGTISILSLYGRPLKEITPKGWTYIFGFDGAADGKGWFTHGRTRDGQGLLHVDLDGDARLLLPDSGSFSVNYAIPSPDGRRLAISGTTHLSSNIWMIENF